jgi:chemotaxis protein MotB
MVDSNHDSQQQPIIVKKKKGGHGGHHGGSWKVAYADFVTAMMAFFLVMWIVGLSPEVKENVAGYFRDPVGFTKGGTKGVLPGGKGPFEKEPGNSMQRNDKRQQKEAEVWQSLKEVGRKIGEKLSKMESFAKLKDQIQIELTADGLRIQLIDESGKTPFFASGSAEMSSEGVEILKTISSEIGKLGYNVVVEGHTDAKTFPGGTAYTNWELSADRANTARRVMLAAGVDESKIKEIRGFAANQPRVKHDPIDPSNRRIAIIVLNEYAAGNYEDVTVAPGKELSLK